MFLNLFLCARCALAVNLLSVILFQNRVIKNHRKGGHYNKDGSLSNADTMVDVIIVLAFAGV